MDMNKVGNQILILRKQKGLTQSELGDRLCVSYQSVSKWERGETLPDTAIVPNLAQVLGTTIDFILLGGEKMIEYQGSVKIADLIKGLKSLESMGILLGKENIIYQSAIKGINTNMNADIEAAFVDDYVFEAFLAEAAIQSLMMGAYIDVTDVKNTFKHDHFKQIVLKNCANHGIK